MKLLNKIKIATLVLTRKCNLHCDYCRFSGDIDYILQPKEYPNGRYYFENEHSPKFWIDIIDRLMKHNKDIFFILFGGEPFLYKGLSDVVLHMNMSNANYTIISNCSELIKPRINELLSSVGKIKGFTASVDPGFWLDEYNDDEIYKSRNGFDMLETLNKNGWVEDPVAEITVDNHNITHLEETVKRLSDKGIYSDITVLDIAKNNYYDFSAITNPTLLVQPTEETLSIFNRLKYGDYKIHMKNILLDSIYNILPANLDCRLGIGNLHNITIECDGTMRCCGRIRGRRTPEFMAIDLFDDEGRDTDMKVRIEDAIEIDKALLCNGCSWTCPIMTTISYDNDINNH
jgi:MoaA/NifB/PqqE/SkfB family radical SAM enzyme